MEQIEQYGLRWTVNVPADPINPIVLKQGGGLVFLGHDTTNIFWGPYLEIKSVMDRNGRIYSLPEKQWFFAKEIENICLKYGMYGEIHWYHELQNGFKFPKDAFKRKKNGYWQMPMTTALYDKIKDEMDAYAIADLFKLMHFAKNSIYVDYTVDQPFLYIDNDTYNKLPSQWTIWDVYRINTNEYDTYRKQHEQLWYDIANARKTNRQIKINVFDPKSHTSVVYTEKVVYGIAMPDVLLQDEERYR